MASISSPGLGSGLDINSIVSQLVAIERQPIDKLKSAASSIQTKISAYGQVQSLVSGVEDAANKLAQASLWTGTTALSSDTSVATATSTGTAAAGTYQLEVTQLAKAHQVRSGAFASATSTMGQAGTLNLSATYELRSGAFTSSTSTLASSGTLKLSVGGASATNVAFTSADTVETLRDKINAAGAGVTARIVTDSTGAYLALTSNTTGTAQAISTAGSTGLPSQLSSLSQARTAVAFTADDTVATLRDKINAAGAGVTANIVTGSINGVSGTYLMLRNNITGAANTISTTGSTNLPTTLALTDVQAAQDAQVKVDGVTITSATNTIADAPTGVTLSLAGTSASPVSVTVNSDTQAQRKAIDDFVSAYNALNSYLVDQTKYDETTKKGGTLQGDSGVLSVRAQLRNALRGTSTASSTFQTLSALGFSLDGTGALSVKDATITSALTKPTELNKLFANVTPTGTTTRGLALRIRDVADALTSFDGVVTSRTDGLRSRLQRNQKDQSTMEDRVSRTQARLLKQYSSLDTKMSKLNGLSSAVSQQLAAFNKSQN